MNAFSPAQFRAQFPALHDAGVYLDSAATALKPQAVIEATNHFYSLSAVTFIAARFGRSAALNRALRSRPRPGRAPAERTER
ncbi:Cysteine sulfinate desulfinase [Kluyvera cryocrescens]|uniref:Cysteine sulfinate desulfinase n=1 Tax=Kluyvera cryocrescens TaxID=580 RepID=A0A485AQS3_KLUCR|nr:Cysteine sulfinate desulfinase [Kluyvera cryocrescens]